MFAAIDKLPENDRKVFRAWLAQMHEGLTDDEAAKQASMTRLSYVRHRNKLQEVLKQQFE